MADLRLPCSTAKQLAATGGGENTGGSSPPHSSRNVSSGGLKFVHQRNKSSSGERSDGGGGGGGGASNVLHAASVVERVRRFSVFTVPQALEVPSSPPPPPPQQPSTAAAAIVEVGSHQQHSQHQHHHQSHHHRESSYDHGGKVRELEAPDDDRPPPAAPAAEPRIESPDGRYIKLRDEIGRGSFKTVYKGLDTQTGMAVAWCELLDRGWSAEDRQKYREEVEMLKALHHPNILQFYESWSYLNGSNKNTVLVTELMSGTLKSYIRLFQKVSMPVLVSWCHQILCGLQFLHSRTPPIIHRDLKCDNVFVIDITGVVKIGDLGLAKLKSSAFVKSVIGTPEFMAPEMYEENYDEAVDVYAFGMCMLEMATCEYPYKECTNAMQIIRKVSNGVKPESLERIENPDVRDIVNECIQVDKAKRPTVSELLGRPFFAPERDMMVEVLHPPQQQRLDGSHVQADAQVITLSLKFGPRKRRGAHNRNEAVQFDFQLNRDSEDSIVQDLFSTGLLYEEDMEPAKSLIREQVENVLSAMEPANGETRFESPTDIDYGDADDLKYKHALECAILREHQRAEVEAHGGVSGVSGGDCSDDGTPSTAAERSEVLACRCLVSRCDEHATCQFAGWLPQQGFGLGGQHADPCAAATASVRAVQRALRGGGGCAAAAIDDTDAPPTCGVEEVRLSRSASATSVATAAAAAAAGRSADQAAAYVKWYLRSGLPYAPAAAARPPTGPSQAEQHAGAVVSRIVRSLISHNDEEAADDGGGGGSRGSPLPPASPDANHAMRTIDRDRPSGSAGSQKARPCTLDVDAHRGLLLPDRCPSPHPHEVRTAAAAPHSTRTAVVTDDDSLRQTRAQPYSARLNAQAVARKLAVQRALQESLQQVQSALRLKTTR